MKSDDKTFNEIVQRYGEPLYWHIRRLVLSHDDAQDVLQETFVKAFRHLWQLRDQSSLRPWLYRIATNEVNRFLGRRRDNVPISEELESMLQEGEYINLNDIAGIKLQKAIALLPGLQRTVFCLKYYDDLDYKEISYITGSKPETLKVSWHIARKKVEQYLNEN